MSRLRVDSLPQRPTWSVGALRAMLRACGTLAKRRAVAAAFRVSTKPDTFVSAEEETCPRDETVQGDKPDLFFEPEGDADRACIESRSTPSVASKLTRPQAERNAPFAEFLCAAALSAPLDVHRVAESGAKNNNLFVQEGRSRHINAIAAINRDINGPSRAPPRVTTRAVPLPAATVSVGQGTALGNSDIQATTQDRLVVLVKPGSLFPLGFDVRGARVVLRQSTPGVVMVRLCRCSPLRLSYPAWTTAEQSTRQSFAPVDAISSLMFVNE